MTPAPDALPDAGPDAGAGRGAGPGVPVWLLDVDGVVNAARPGWEGPVHHGRAVVDGVGYDLRWAEQLIRQITELHCERAAEVRWATTWVDHVVQVEQMMALPRFDTAFVGLGRAPSTKTPDLKLAAALAVVERERRPLIWTDDDAIPGSGPERRRLEGAGVPVLLIVPDTRHGLQRDDLATIRRFSRYCRDRRPGPPAGGAS